MRRLPLTVLTLLLCLAACTDNGTDDQTSESSTSSAPAVDADTSEPAVDGDDEASAEAATAQNDRFPSVIGATAAPDGDGTWRFDVTISSPYDSPERYADAWRVLGPDGVEYGIRVLTHDHASEQPFTRSQGGIAIPSTVQVVTIEGRDLTNGWGGPTYELSLPEDGQ